VVGRPFIFDTDGGIDDAQALLLLIAHGVAPDVITTVFGNVAVDRAVDNMLATLAIAGAHIPVHRGADRPLEQPIIDARHVHGEDGLGGAPRPPVTEMPAEGDAVSVMIDIFGAAAAAGRKSDIMLVGPLTNFALALTRAPSIIGGIGRVTTMSATLFGRGNSTPAAEFNVYADPEAAQVVFSAPLDMVIVPWEPCVSHAMKGEAVDAIFARLPETPAAAFSRALARHLRQGVLRWMHRDELRIVDPLAAAVVVDPRIVMRSLHACVQVSLSPGIARGLTVIDPSGRLGTPRFTLVEEVDAARLHDLYAVSVAYSPHQALETT
jgi:purine nucleosidase/non-specific riboncleoside hydrolase